MKRLISAILVVVMLLCCATPAFAQSGEGVTQRDTILMLDISDSMAGTPLAVMKEAAIKFCSQLLNTPDDNRIALVIWDYSYSTYSFSSDLDSVISTISNITLGRGTNTSQALSVANNLMTNSSRADAIKNIVLLTDGIPQHGTGTEDGPYVYEDTEYYRYANAAYNEAKKVTEKYNLYTLGFFHSLSHEKLQFAQRFLKDIQNAGYYEVIDPDELEFTFGDVAEDINSGSPQPISFKYDRTHSATCYFTTDYFSDSAYTYNHSLGTMSLALAMSAFGVKSAAGDDSVAYQNSHANAKDLLMKIGMDENAIVPYGYDTKPTTDSIAAVFGNMPISVGGSSYTLLTIAVRGGGYEQEWASNFTMGTQGQHRGFNAAKNKVLSRLKSYIAEQEISGPVKFWITGYSRAAATANLVAGQLDYDLWRTNGSEFIDSEITYSCDDIYAYCFETPMGAEKTGTYGYSFYNNIFNIINPNDPVTYVAPSYFSFGRYGVDKYLPSAESDAYYSGKKRNMLEVYNSLPTTGEYVVDDFQMKKLNMEIDVNLDWFNSSTEITWVHDDTKNNYSQGVFLSNYVTILAKEFFKDRNTFVSTYQSEIREICSVAFGCTDDQRDILIETLTEQAKNNWGALAWSYFYNAGVRSLFFWNWWNAGEREDEALKIVSGWLRTAIQTAGITDYDDDVIEAAGKDLGDLALALISNHPNYFTTAVCNASGLGAAHYPELCFSWMASMDKNYTGEGTCSFTNGSFRVIHINCDVDVDVLDENGNSVALITNEDPQEVSGSSIISAINEDNEKIIILPANAPYDLVIAGRNDDLVNISIAEYCASEGDFTRTANYFDINLSAGDTLNGTIPAYSEEELASSTPNGSDANYVIKDSQNNVITCDVELTGEEATSAYYEVSVSASDESAGYVIGGGLYQYGSFAQVEAVEAAGYQFSGWYENQTLVSTDKAYRFCVTKDTALVAKFTGMPAPITFTDVAANAWYYEAVKFAVSNNLMNGVGNNRFEPNTPMTRAMLVTVLWRYEGAPKGGSNTFRDVPSGQWYTEAVSWAAANGIVDGVGNNRFDPNGSITREQLAAILFRYSQSKGYDTSARGSFAGFPDTNRISRWASDSYSWAVGEKLITGNVIRGVSYLDPHGTATRAQVATILMRYIQSEHTPNTYDPDEHTYDFVVGKFSWADAQRIASLRGGYLARIDNADEYRYITSLLSKDRHYDTTFFIGARRFSNYDYFFVDRDDNIVSEKLNTASSWTSPFWLSGEPTFRYDGVEEWIVAIEYKPAEGRWLLNDIPDNASYPADPNCHGFIIEYEP